MNALEELLTGGRLVHEDNGGVGNQLHCNGQPLPLLDRQTTLAWASHHGTSHGLQLHQAKHLQPATMPSVTCSNRDPNEVINHLGQQDMLLCPVMA